MIPKASPQEATEFLKQHPDLDSIDLLLPDLNGVFRGKRVLPAALKHVYEDGVCLSKSLFASDIRGETADDADIGFNIGDMDCRCWPIPGSLVLSPWKKQRPEAQLQLTMDDGDGLPYAGDPQQVLAKLLDQFLQRGLRPVVAVELEFYLVDRHLDDQGQPQQPISPITGLRQNKTQVYGIDDLDDFGDFIAGVNHASRIQNLPTDVAVAEYAPGQFEINLKHQADAQNACRHGLWLKRMIKGVAQSHGMEATFMAKPFIELAGSGTHIHVSLIDESGKNVFAGTSVNPLLKHAIGGLLAVMPESSLIYAPTANSYRRFVEDFYVPMARTWGVNNRTVAIRVPTGDPAAMRLEHRVSGADCNPYLLASSVLAGMLFGLENQSDPGPQVTGNAYEQTHEPLPKTWHEALSAFREAKILKSYLGEEFCRIFVETKQQEYDAFNRIITPTEYDWYLRSS